VSERGWSGQEPSLPGTSAAPVLPAAATTTTLRSTALWMATCSSAAPGAFGRAHDTSEMLITPAPSSTACTTALASVSRLPAGSLRSAWPGTLNDGLDCRMEMISAAGATPANPVPGSATAAAMPATAVPCPSQSASPLPPAT